MSGRRGRVAAALGCVLFGMPLCASGLAGQATSASGSQAAGPQAATKRPAPSFTAAGPQGNIAPSGYSDGSREDEVRQVAGLVSDLQEASYVEALPTGVLPGCERQAELLHAALTQGGFAADRKLGQFYLQHGEFGLSVTYLSEAAKSQPEDAATARELAVAELGAHDDSAADSVAARLSARDPADATARRVKGSVEAAAGHSAAALAEYERALSLDGGAKNVYAAALSMMALGALPDAERALRAGTGSRPDAAKLWLALGMVEALQSRETQAADALLRAAALDRDDRLAPTLLATLTANAEEGDRIFPVMRAFAAAHPAEAVAHYDYALVLAKAARRGAESQAEDKVAGELRAAIAAQPKFAAAHFQLGLAEESAGDERAAVDELAQAVSLEPEVAAWHYRLARAYRRAGQVQAGESEMERFKDLQAKRAAGEGVSARLLDGLPTGLLGVAPARCEAGR